MNASNLGPICSDNSVISSSLNTFQNSLKIGHWNITSFCASSSNGKFEEVRHILEGNHLDIVGFSETWLKPYILSQAINVPGYSICRNDRLGRRGGGVALLLSHNVKYRPIFMSEGSDTYEALFVEIILHNVKLLVGVCYLTDGNLGDFEDSVGDLLVRYSNVIVMGDFNTNMFCPVDSVSLRSMCQRLDLNYRHNSIPTHYHVGCNTTSLIDYFLLSKSILVGTSGQMQCPGVSRHSLIFIAVDIPISSSKRFVSYPDYKALKTEELEAAILDCDFGVMYLTEDVNLQLEIFMSNVNSLHSLVPIVRREVGVDAVNWFIDRKISFQISLRDLAYRHYLEFRTPQNWAIYCANRNRVKRIIRKLRMRAHTQLFQNFDSKQMWNFLRNNGCLESEEHLTFSDPNDINDYFVSCQIPDSEDYYNPIGSSRDSGFSFECVDIDTLLMALCRIKSNAVGHDSLPLKFLKIVFPFVSSHLLHLVNTIINTSCFPWKWKIARVVPIRKEGQSVDFDNLRPISILPVLSKVVEHILKDQMIEHLDRNALIHPSQSGFRRGYSTTSLLLGLTDSIRQFLDSRKNVVLISVDLSKAFDRVIYSRLLRKLCDNFDFSHQACGLIRSYLYGRLQYVSIGSSLSQSRRITSGVPQGSVIGPLLFMLYLDDLLQISNGVSCLPFVYADDVQFVCYSDTAFLDVLEVGVNYVIREVMSWAAINGFCVNPVKTKLMGFGFNTEDVNIVINGVPIEFVNKMKCLGLVLDNLLNFSPHVDNLSSRVSFLLKRLYSLNIYLPLSMKARVAKAILMPHILYCTEIFTGAGSHVRGKYKIIFNRIIRYVFNLKRRDHVSRYALSFIGSSFENFVSIRLLLFLYKSLVNGYPVYIVNKFNFSHSLRNPQIIYPVRHLDVYKRSFQIRVSRIWNALPRELREFTYSYSVFKSKLLEYSQFHVLNVP